MSDTKKSKPKAPPMSPVRGIAKMSDAEFNKLQKAVKEYTKEKGPVAVAALFKSFNEGRDRKQYYKNVDTAEQLVPIVKAEAKRRKEAKDKTKMKAGGMAGKAKAAKKMMRGGVAKKKMRGGGMAKMAQKKMMRGGMAKKKMMRGGAVKKK